MGYNLHNRYIFFTAPQITEKLADLKIKIPMLHSMIFNSKLQAENNNLRRY